MKKVSLISLASLTSLIAAQAQTIINWDGGGSGDSWSTSGNWAGDNTPDNNTEKARYVGGATFEIDVDSNHTINGYIDGFAGEGTVHSLAGAGTLTIDGNTSSTVVGIDNATGNTGATLNFKGNVTIDNNQGGITTIRNQNSSGNVLLFDTSSVLVTNSLLETIPGNGVGSIKMNGTFGASSANLRINSNNVSFGTGHDSSGYGADIVMLVGSKLTIDDGTVLNTGRKFQVNGNSEIEFNGENAINDANISVSGSNSIFLNVDANQDDMGILTSVGDMTIDLDASVSLLAFDNSSAFEAGWGAGEVTIVGFMDGVIRFGTDASGLTSAQLALIDEGAYTLDSSGFLVAIPEPSTFALALGALTLFTTARRRSKSVL